MRPLSYSIPKHLIPLSNKPLLQYNVEKVSQAGMDEIGIVVSPETKHLYRSLLGDRRWGADFTYIDQPDPKGLAHAVYCAREFVGEEPFLVYLGDNLLEDSLRPMVEEFTENRASASLLLAPVEDPERFGVARIQEGRILELVEKPDDPPSNLAIVGSYLFTPKIFDAINRIEPSDRGELEITDAIQQLIDDGEKVIPEQITGWWQDVGRPSDAIEANRILLEEVESRIEGNLESTQFKGRERINVGSDVRISDSTVRGPAIIGPGVTISDSVVGPYASIGEGCKLEDVKVSNSILVGDSTLKGGQLKDSILGRKVCLELPSGEYKVKVGNQASITR